MTEPLPQLIAAVHARRECWRHVPDLADRLVDALEKLPADVRAVVMEAPYKSTMPTQTVV